MQHFDSGGVDIAFLDDGDGPATLLIHGFASNARVNWVSTSWQSELLAAGRRVIAFDNRGHGESGKPHDPAAYPAPVMAEDARRLLDHLKIEKADVIGYSMGARIAAFLALKHGARVRSVVFSGMGERMVTGGGRAEAIAAALLADSPDEITDERALAFRTFADKTGSDRKALAACMMSERPKITPEALATLSVPVLVAVGSDDDIAGSPEGLAKLIPEAEVFVIEARDHMRSVGDKTHKAAVLDFLARRS